MRETTAPYAELGPITAELLDRLRQCSPEQLRHVQKLLQTHLDAIGIGPRLGRDHTARVIRLTPRTHPRGA